MVLVILALVAWWGWETFRPASVTRWRAEIAAAESTPYDFLNTEHHYRHAIDEARHFGPHDARLADSLFALAERSNQQSWLFPEDPKMVSSVSSRVVSTRRNPLQAVHDNSKHAYVRLLLTDTRIEELYLESLHIAEVAYARQPLLLAQKYDAVGDFYALRKDLHRAGCNYEHAFALREKKLGARSPQLVAYLFKMGNFYSSRSLEQQAATYHRRALEIIEKTYGSSSPQLQSVLTDLGGLFFAQQQYEKALPYYQRAFHIAEHRLGPDAPRIWETGSMLILIYTRIGDTAHAAQLREREQESMRQHPEYNPH